jgi:hypothetical protein
MTPLPFVRLDIDRPLPPIASAMSRGQTAEQAMKRFLARRNFESKRLPKSKRETLRPF